MRLMIPKLRQETTVRLIMTEKQFLITVAPSTTIEKAFGDNCPGDIDMLPVTKDGQLLGVLRRDAKHAPSATAEEVMEPAERYRHHVDTPVEDVLDELARAHPLAIVKGKKLLGVLTYADLNRRAFRVLLYALLAELEGRLADAIREKYTEPGALLAKHESSMSEPALKRWKKSEKDDVAIHPVEGMDLSDLADIFAKDASLRKELNLHSRGAVEDSLGGLVTLRNDVMHPVRLLVRTPEDVRQLEGRLERLQILLDRTEASRRENSPRLSLAHMRPKR